MKTRREAEDMGVVQQDLECVGFHELLDWQIIQYRQTVDDYRKELSREQHRCVSWQEAEQEFSRMGLMEVGKEWRIEFCGMMCSERKKCLLALHFMQSCHTEALYKAG